MRTGFAASIPGGAAGGRRVLGDGRRLLMMRDVDEPVLTVFTGGGRGGGAGACADGGPTARHKVLIVHPLAF